MTSWRDEFTSLDTNKWGTSTGGAGSAGVAGGKLSLAIPATNDAAIAYLKTKIDKTKRQLYAIGYCLVTPDADADLSSLFALNVINDASAPQVTDNATWNPKQRISVYVHWNSVTSKYEIYLNYYDGADYQHWNPATNAWQVAGVFLEELSGNDEYYVYLEINDSGQWRIMVNNSSDCRWIAITDWVNFSALAAPNSDLWLVMGEPYTNFYHGDMTLEWFSYYDGRTYWATFNGSGMNGGANAGNYCFRANIYRKSFGVVGFPWRAPLLEAADFPGGAGITGVYYPFIFKYQGKQYIFCTASDSNIWYFTTTDEGDSITRPQDAPIVSKGGVGWRQSGVMFEAVIRDKNESDPNKQWKMYVAGQDAAGISRIGYYYAAEPPGAGNWVWTEYGSNPVIDRNDTPGAWNRYGVFPGDIVPGTTKLLYVAGRDSWAPSRWAVGLYTSSDWESWSEYGGNPIFTRDFTKTQDLTADLASGATSVTMGDSSAFSVGDVVVIYDDGDAANHKFDIDRVKAIPDGTHVTLDKGASRNYTVANGAVIRGLNYWSSTPRDTKLSPSRFALPTLFQVMNDGTFVNEPRIEPLGYLTSTDDTDWTLSMAESIVIPFSDTSGYFYRSAENISGYEEILTTVAIMAPAMTNKLISAELI